MCDPACSFICPCTAQRMLSSSRSPTPCLQLVDAVSSVFLYPPHAAHPGRHRRAGTATCAPGARGCHTALPAARETGPAVRRPLVPVPQLRRNPCAFCLVKASKTCAAFEVLLVWFGLVGCFPNPSMPCRAGTRSSSTGGPSVSTPRAWSCSVGTQHPSTFLLPVV